MNDELSGARPWGPLDGGPAPAAQAQARRGNRRRLLVFGLTFALALVLGQLWNFSRSSDYRASTRLQVNLPEVGRPGLSASGAYATKLQLFDSLPTLSKLADALVTSGLPVDRLGTDPASRLQSMLQVVPVHGSEIVELRAIGPEPRLLADMLNAFPDVIRQEIASRQRKEADAQLDTARQELARLERKTSERRARLEEYRQREGVLAERDDNEAVARSKGLDKALDTAVEKEAAAAARLNAVTRAVEQGKSSTQVRADPTLSGLETRAHQTREDLKELERTYTPEFLAMDPRARALRARLAELENQIVRQRTTGLQAALQSAQEDQASAQAQVERLRTQISTSRPALAKTSMRFGEAKVLEDDLAQVDKARRELLERVARLEADEQRRVAVVTVVEPATLPLKPFRPDHRRDAALVLAAAAGLALAVMGIVEAFNRVAPAASPASNTTLVLTPGWADRQAQPSVQGMQASPLLAASPHPPPTTAALAAPIQVLSQPEATALLAAADGPSRFLCAAGLMGLSMAEALRVRPRDLDAGALRLSVGGPWARQLPMPAWLARAHSGSLDADQPVLCDATGQPLAPADVASMVISAALDAGLARATSLDWDVLRNTSIDWLVGQGLRYADLPKLVGRVDAQMLQSLSSRHGESKRRELGAIDLLMPALQVSPRSD